MITRTIIYSDVTCIMGSGEEETIRVYGSKRITAKYMQSLGYDVETVLNIKPGSGVYCCTEDNFVKVSDKEEN